MTITNEKRKEIASGITSSFPGIHDVVVLQNVRTNDSNQLALMFKQDTDIDLDKLANNFLEKVKLIMGVKGAEVIDKAKGKVVVKFKDALMKESKGSVISELLGKAGIQAQYESLYSSKDFDSLFRSVPVYIKDQDPEIKVAEEILKLKSEALNRLKEALNSMSALKETVESRGDLSEEDKMKYIDKLMGYRKVADKCLEIARAGYMFPADIKGVTVPPLK